MSPLDRIILNMGERVSDLRFEELYDLCEFFFGAPCQRGTGFAVFSMPWPDDPLLSIQDQDGRARPHQVRQVIAAIERMKNTGPAH